MMKDPNEEAFRQSLRYSLASDTDPEDSTTLEPSLGLKDLFKIKLKTTKEGIQVPIVKRFYMYLLLAGLMPSFNNFLYYFAIDVLEITKFEMGISTSLVGVVIVSFPLIYQRYFKDSEYRNLFFVSILI